MADNSKETKRIALVVAALTGEELQATQKDAVRIYGILIDEDFGMCDRQESKLIQSCKSRKDFDSAISSTLKDWNSSNQFILYFSGHGEVRKNIYCFKFGKELYPFKNLLNELEIKGVNRTILILDTCHSGAAMGTKSEGDSTIIEKEEIPQGTAIITSSKKIEQSYEKKDGSNSVFTNLLCEGIKTGLGGIPTDDGRINVSDIIKYIRNKLLTAEYSNYYQTPSYDISKADKSIWITKNPSGQIKQQKKDDRDNFQNTDIIQSYDELKILYEQHAPKFHPCLDANIDELDLVLLKEYSNKIEPGLYNPQNLDEVLTKLILYSPIPHNGRKYFHKSAVLCFYKKPHKIYSSARSIFVLGNPSATNFTREDIYGPLSHQFTQLIQKVENNIIQQSYIEKDGRRRDLADIDMLVVREMISNAIVHRDYEAKSNVKVTVTKEAVEVSNPGSFPPDKPWDNFLESSFAISKPNDETIALYLTTLLAFEGIGRGFEIFKNYIKENGSDSLTCKEESGHVFVRLLRRQFSQELFGGINIGGNFSQELFGDNNIQQIPSPQLIPYSSTSNFVGRDDVLTTLHDKLQQTNTMPICAVVGMGGLGKTQLAVRYSHQHEADYPGGICWIKTRESNFESLAAQIVDFVKFYIEVEVPQEIAGTPLNLKQQLDWCWRNWKPKFGKVLIVFDDVTDWKSCNQALPTFNRFSVLITTRLRNFNPRLVDEISLDVLSPENARELLIDLVGDTNRFVDEKIISKLCERLGYLPLSLQLVGAYLADDPGLSLGEMLQLLNQQSLNSDVLKSPDSIQLGVKDAFNLSWLKLDKQTQLVGKLLSLSAPDIIPWQLVEKVSQQLNWNSNHVSEARKQLYKFNLIQLVSSQGSLYSIHVLIRDFFKDELIASEETARDLKRAFVGVMLSIAKKIPQTPTRSDIESVEDTIPHLKEVAENLIAVVEDEDLIWAFVGIAWFYEGQGLYTLAEPWYEQCLSTTKQRLGQEHPDVASSLNNLAGLYRLQGRYEQAQPLFLQALELRKKLLGQEHPDVASSLNNLALLYKLQGRYEQAEPLYLQALELRKKLLGQEHPDVATSLNNLALLYYSQGRYEQAEPLYLQALELRKKLLGQEHPYVTISLDNLALLYESQGRYEQAEPLYLQALELRKKLLEEEHPYVAISLNNLAGLYRLQGRYEQAEPLYLQALELRKKLLGQEHPYVANSLDNLALLYYSQGRYKEAEPLFLQALELSKRLLGEEHPDLATSLNNLALLYYSQGRYKEAEPLFLQALELRKKLLGQEHPDVATSLNNLAELYRSQSRYEQAEPLYLQALEIAEQKLGVNHPNTVTFRENLQNLRDKRQSRFIYCKPWYLKSSAFILYFFILLLAVLISRFVLGGMVNLSMLFF
ncbi:MAG: tetratricopeptide repeat protein [Cyanobacteria bacterium P01_H01_bin.150]